MQLAPGTILVGKFRLERPLSRGGMGSVWVARHLQLGTLVAVKFMAPAYAASPAFRARFEREARAAAQLKSPHIVQVLDFGIDETGVPYLAMELLDGEDLSARLARRGRLPLPEATRLLVQAGKALRGAHEAGLVHRDLKPANLFLARAAGEDEDLVKLLDFGIAKDTTATLSAEASTTGEVMGSPHYMSPEQLRAEKDVDARSDLWALGVITFRMVTGHLPFPGDVIGHVVTKILVDPIPSATQLAPDLPPAIDAFFTRALARDRAHRFQSVRELVDAFSRVAGAPQFSSSVSGVSSPFGQPTADSRASSGLPAASASTQGVEPAALKAIPATPQGTLTGAIHVGGNGSRRAQARFARAAWILAIGATIAVGALGVGLAVLFLRSPQPATPSASTDVQPSVASATLPPPLAPTARSSAAPPTIAPVNAPAPASVTADSAPLAPEAPRSPTPSASASAPPTNSGTKRSAPPPAATGSATPRNRGAAAKPDWGLR